jgi:hypothetical protein
MKPKYIFIHHTGVSYTQNPNQWKATDNYHKAKGWGGGGYNYEISKAGGVHQFRKDGAFTAAQYQNNMNNGQAISIALDGHFDHEEPTDKQCKAIWELMNEKMEKHGIPEDNILNHREIAPKTCPGTMIWDNPYAYFKDRVGAGDKASEWALEAQDWVKEYGISDGKRPQDSISREEVWVMLKRFSKL